MCNLGNERHCFWKLEFLFQNSKKRRVSGVTGMTWCGAQKSRPRRSVRCWFPPWTQLATPSWWTSVLSMLGDHTKVILLELYYSVPRHFVCHFSWWWLMLNTLGTVMVESRLLQQPVVRSSQWISQTACDWTGGGGGDGGSTDSPC